LYGSEGRAAVRIGRVDLVGLGCNGHFLRYVSNLKSGGQIQCLSDTECNMSAFLASEVRGRNLHRVVAGVEVRNGVVAARIRFGFFRFIGRDVGDFHRGVWDSGPGWIRDLPGHGGAKVLRSEKSDEYSKKGDETGKAIEFRPHRVKS